MIRTTLPQGWESVSSRRFEPRKQHYGAVMSVPLVQHQRIELATGVSQLLVISRTGSLFPAESRLPQSFVVDMNGIADVDLLFDYYRQSRVGLVTSLVDGETAVLEYQLCGLPVVTTACFDHRTEWVDPLYLRIVPDSPSAIAAAVDGLARMRYDPSRVREAFLKRWNRWIKEPWCDDVSDLLPLSESGHYRTQRVAAAGRGVLGDGHTCARAMPAIGRAG